MSARDNGQADSEASKLNQYEVVCELGKGTFGVVSKIRRKSDGRMFVWKEMSYKEMSTKLRQLIVAEVNILSELRSQFVVKFYDRIIDRANSKLYIIMECCEGGDLASLVKRQRTQGTNVDEEFIWKVLSQLVWAIHDCHSHPKGVILHRDIKPANIFVDTKRNEIKVGDFGLARMLEDQDQFATTIVGTPYYMSPEQINNEKYNQPCDVWAMGCSIYELAALRPPFEARTSVALATKIMVGKFDRIPALYSDELQNVISKMLVVQPEERITLKELLENRNVALRVREIKVQMHYRTLRLKEEELLQRERKLKARQQEVDAMTKQRKESSIQISVQPHTAAAVVPVA